MQITKEQIAKFEPCEEGLAWFQKQNITDLKELSEIAILEGKFDWAIWLGTKLMTPKQNVKLAVFCAEQCLEIYERQYPTDNRPRKAISVAKGCISAAGAARAAAYAAAYAAAADAAGTAQEVIIRFLVEILSEDKNNER